MNRNPGKTDIVGHISDILLRRGAESYLGEAVSMSGHMLQCARLARSAGASDELVAAALLHDIGHYSNEFPEDALEVGINNFHERAGAALLAGVFPPLVVEPVRLHVAAKRYLCAVEPGYHARLSAASVHTLELQGGAMTTAACREFEKNPYHLEALRLRRWDEEAKVPVRETAPFEDYVELLRGLTSGSGTEREAHGD